MKKLKRSVELLLLGMMLSGGALALTGCEEGAFEEAGEEVDDAADDAADGLDDAAD